MKSELLKLKSVGPATVKDLNLLGIRLISQLRRCDPFVLYNQLCEKTQTKHDQCCIDVFKCAIEQAGDPKLNSEKKQWWYWSEWRKKTAQEKTNNP